MTTPPWSPVAPAAPKAASGPALAPPPTRASWSGLLQLSLVTIPVKAYPATATAPDVPGHLLHAGCGQRVRYEKRCPVHGPLEAGALVKGYAYAPGHFLVLDEAELDALRPANERALSLDRCCDLGHLDPALFAGRTLYLLPDGPAARPAFAVLARALHQRQCGLLGRVVLAGRRQVVFVRPAGNLLVLHVLHYPAQLRNPAGLAAEHRPAVAGDAETQLAGTLLDACRGPVDWADYQDDAATRLAALVEAKLHGPPPAVPAPEERPVLSLVEALRQSVAAVQATAPLGARPPTPPISTAAPPVARAAASGKPRQRNPRRST